MTYSTDPYKIIKANENILLALFNFLKLIRLVAIPRNVKKKIERNKNLNGIEKGKSCYILMGGLSVRDVNIDELKKYDIITANHFFRTEDYQKLRPKYHVVTDQNFFTNDQNMKDLKVAIKDFTTVFLNLRKTVQCDKDNFKYILPCFRVISENIKIDISKPCSSFSTVTLACIQIAIFLGYAKIYLVGFDLPPGHMPHYYAESDIEIQGKSEYQEVIDEFKYCSLYWQYTNCHHEAYKLQKYAIKNKIKIYNLSANSYVRAFPHLEFCES